MAEMRRRRQGNPYSVVGTSALAYTAYADEARADMPPVPPRVRLPARRAAPRGMRALTILISLGVICSALVAVSIGKRTACRALERQIADVESAIRRVEEDNRILEWQLASVTDGEVIRNYAVNTLGMTHIRPEAIRTVRLPNTRPNGEKRAAGMPEIHTRKSGFMSTLADLLRLIHI